MVDELRELLEFFAEEILPRVETYRGKQVNKYFREKELEYGGDQVKLERYKNRVRVIDIFLPPVRQFLIGKGILRPDHASGEYIIP